jgi:hypothetical protein
MLRKRLIHDDPEHPGKKVAKFDRFEVIDLEDNSGLELVIC